MVVGGKNIINVYKSLIMSLLCLRGGGNNRFEIKNAFYFS